MGFVTDQLVNGTRFRALPIVDVLTRGVLDISSLSGCAPSMWSRPAID
jgi:hypothetical protein